MVKLNIKGSSFAAQYRRPTARFIDSTDGWGSLGEAMHRILKKRNIFRLMDKL